jgi:multicomponent Na+:H+ antiporter subunit E
VGIAVAALIAFLTGNMFTRKPCHFGRISRYLWIGYYAPLLLWECLKANIDVALRVIKPGLPMKPGIVKIKTTLKSDTALAFLANSITLAPGTLCVDIAPEEGLLYIHWIDVGSKDIEEATQLIAGKFESILKRIFE